mmetsp:Transcript_15294/g.50242  ORF Transcript_15294/g.50242 Transcript_15294/m.50242 type:complete len:245 (+) Transcript_15294:33-767(+)
MLRASAARARLALDASRALARGAIAGDVPRGGWAGSAPLRWLNDDASAPTEPDRWPPSDYNAPLSQLVRRVKFLSVGGLTATIFGSPLLVQFTAPDMAMQAQAILCGSVIGFSGLTTGLLQWFVSPYVHKLRMVDRETVSVEVLDVFARFYERRFKVAEVKTEVDTMRPLCSFEAGGKILYVEVSALDPIVKDTLGLLTDEEKVERDKGLYTYDAEGEEDEDDDEEEEDQVEEEKEKAKKEGHH